MNGFSGTFSLSAPLRGLLRAGLLAGVATSLVACASDPNKERPTNPFKAGGALDSGKKQLSERELRLEAQALYALARRSLELGDFDDALLRYDALTERYPFTEYATQAEVERVYALDKQFKPDEALAAADRFLREHPRFARADYVQYLKGVISQERDRGLLESLPFVDASKGDTTNLRRAFDDFALLVQKHPASAYNADARLRMAALRNRMAEHDLHVVRYYMKRGAFLAAAKRGEQVLALYPGAPATVEALDGLRVAYQALGLRQQEQDANLLYANNAVRNAEVASRREDTLATPGMSTRLSAAGTPEPSVAIVPVSSTAAEAGTVPNAAPKLGRTGGFFAKVASFFSFADRSDKAPLELVLPSPAGEPAAPSSAPGVGTGSAAKAENETGTRRKTGLIIEVGDGDGGDESSDTKPAAKPVETKAGDGTASGTGNSSSAGSERPVIPPAPATPGR